MIIRLTAKSWDAVANLPNALELYNEANKGFKVVDALMRVEHDVFWTFLNKDEHHVCASCQCPITPEEYCYEERVDAGVPRRKWICLNCATDAALAAGVLTDVPRAWIESE